MNIPSTVGHEPPALAAARMQWARSEDTVVQFRQTGATACQPASSHSRMQIHEAPEALAIGVVTYNNSAGQLQRLIRSAELADRNLDKSRYRSIILSLDCGAPAHWAASGIPRRQIESKGNLGFGRGMNQLMEEAFGRPSVSWFLCVNPDGILHHKLFAELLLHSALHPDSLIEARQFPGEHPKPYDVGSGLTVWASGACVLIPRRIYETIGGFDENIFMYMEDVDYGWRARSAGFSTHVAPRALFSHSVLDRSQDLLIEKHYYLSARYLAYKWRRPSEQVFFERVILDRGYATALPTLPKTEHPQDTRVAMFEHGFAYAPVRWS
jgi:N-acetylglucosaminyl-diphospho-decaprenol L-rhamnosyltransferase